MPSIFDLLLGRQAQGPALPGMLPVDRQLSSNDPMTASIFDDTPSARDTLMGLSRGLLAAGGPSPTPIGLGQALGQGLSGALAANEGLEDKRLKRALVTSQVQKAQSDISADKLLNDAFLGKGPPAATSPVSSVTPPVGAPTPRAPGAGGGGPSNPTNPGNLADGRGGFQTFKTPEDGVAGAIKLAQEFPKRYNGGQPMTLAQIEAHWSPPDDGRDPMTRGNKQGVWSGNVARAMGIDPNIPLDFNNPQIGLAFAKAVHQAEHPPGTGYQPDVYQRGASLAYGLPAFSTPGAATPTQAMLPPPSAVPAGIPAPAPGQPGPIAQPPVQLAGAPAGGPPVMPPQGDAPPAGGQQIAQAPPAPAAPKNLQDVINTMPPGVRQLAPGMTRQGKIELLMKYADPETRPAIDTTTGAVVFAPKNDNSGRYAPVDMMRLDIEKQNAESQKRQAGAREESNRIRGANEPMQPPAVAGGTPTPTPGFAEQKGAITGAEETAKVLPSIKKYQAELAMKDHEVSQNAATAARSSNANLDRLQSLLANVSTGKGTETINDLKATAKAAGFDLTAMGIPDDVGVVQAAKALTAKMTLELGSSPDGGLKGSFSDRDVAFLKSGIAGLDTTPEGRKLIVDLQKRVNQRAIDVAQIKNEYVRSGKFAQDPAGMWAEVKKFADEHPLFDPAKDIPKVAAPTSGSLSMPSTDALSNAVNEELRRRKAGGK